MEELGIVTKVKGKFIESEYVYSHGAFNIIAYFVDIISGDIVLKDHDKVEYIP